MNKFPQIHFGLIATAILGTLLIPMNAFAIPYGSNKVYKATEKSKTIVVFSATPGSKIEVNLGNVPKVRARIVGACGEVKIRPLSSNNFMGLKVDGKPIHVATLTQQTFPACRNGSFAEARRTNFKTPNNEVIIVGKTPNAAVAVELLQPTKKTITVNACGFGILRPAKDRVLPASFTVNSTSYTVASLPDATKPPLCRTKNGVSTSYVPSSWP
ncbi:hypothetical protein NUACC21_31350 [Scytonema sp. NUACC21]